MRALQWTGVNEVRTGDVPDARIEQPYDAVVQVTASVTCGSDLHLLGGYIPFLRHGDVIGHEFLGEVVEVGPGVRDRRVGERVVVSSFIACGSCWYCRQQLFSLCDNGNRNPGVTETLWGSAPGGCFGYSHALGGYPGSHAEYVRVPFADVGAFPVPDEVQDLRALFASDAASTGWMGAADLGEVGPGDVVAVWGAGGVGQMAARASQILGADRVVVVETDPYRREVARRELGCDVLDPQDALGEALLDLTAGRGPDVCIEAVGMEASGGTGPLAALDKVTQLARVQTERITPLREAVYQCRKGGRVAVLGVFAAWADRFPLGALMNKGLTLRGAQMHGQKYIPTLLDLMARDELTPEYLATHVLDLEDGAEAYRLFKEKDDGCLRAVLRPGGV